MRRACHRPTQQGGATGTVRRINPKNSAWLPPAKTGVAQARSPAGGCWRSAPQRKVCLVVPSGRQVRCCAVGARACTARSGRSGGGGAAALGDDNGAVSTWYALMNWVLRLVRLYSGCCVRCVASFSALPDACAVPRRLFPFCRTLRRQRFRDCAPPTCFPPSGAPGPPRPPGDLLGTSQAHHPCMDHGLWPSPGP